MGRSTNQSGMTLVETLMALALTVLILVPMLGWAQFTFAEQVRTEQRNAFSNDLGLLRTYLHRDVASADAVVVSGARFIGCAPVDRLLLSVYNEETLIAYSVSAGDGAGNSIWRSSCAATDDEGPGPVDDSAELITDLDADATAVSCASTRREDAADGSCPRVTLSLATNSSKRATISAMIRSDWSKETSEGTDPADNAPLIAMAASPTTGERNLTVSFDSEGTVDPLDESLSYLWEFGDGTTSTEPGATHTYRDLGYYSAVLTATNASGLSSSSFVVIGVTNRAPVAVIANPPTGTETHRGEVVSFSSNGSNDAADPSHVGSIVGYTWDFGDGTTSTAANPTKRYDAVSPAEGFTVVLTVTDEDGGTARARTRVVVANRVPTVTITATPGSGASPLRSTLRAAVVDEVTMDSNPALSYLWDFGNGTTSNQAEPPAVTYSGDGNYTVNLVVVDDMGEVDTASTVISVDNAQPFSYPRNLKVVTLKPQPRLTMSFTWSPVTGADAYWLELTCKKCSGPINWIVTGTDATVNIPKAKTHYTIRIRAREAATALWGEWSPTIKKKSAK